jgi:hypothetical protein
MKEKITSIDSKSTSKAATKKSNATAKRGDRLQVRLSAATNSLLRTAIAANRGLSASFVTELAVKEWLFRNPFGLQMPSNEVQLDAKAAKTEISGIDFSEEETAKAANQPDEDVI